ncbi:RNA polymerase sigma factor [Streptomyces cadmiisoli]|uniref:RNA polymerase sigma factor n=1 Tax=Streptomyces cadmiisoli TaxID=2184053 RepID=A0A2Z4J8G5_9ACTN|nr:RNA polymerase sigma factor [Streptomyces cadmiisoli]AWW41444.1 RNA polymerase sigma factor [Streptomyces cadmiisoli]
MEDSLRTRIRAGDEQAFAQLFRAHATAVYAYAARLTGDGSAAEDAVSLTFLEAWRLRQKLLPDSEWPGRTPGSPEDGGSARESADDGLRPWIFGIATNVLRNMQRTARRHSAALARLPRQDAEDDFSEDLVARLEDAERLAAARTALGRLRKREREVFALCVWSELSYAEAAAALDVPVSTVRSRLARARQRLRRLAESELGRRSVIRSRGKPRPSSPTGQEKVGRTDAARLTQ